MHLNLIQHLVAVVPIIIPTDEVQPPWFSYRVPPDSVQCETQDLGIALQRECLHHKVLQLLHSSCVVFLDLADVRSKIIFNIKYVLGVDSVAKQIKSEVLKSLK